MRSRSLTHPALLVALVALAGCSSPRTQRVPTGGSLAATRTLPPPPPRPQVMLGATAAPEVPAQRTLLPMTEEQRTEMLRAVGSPIRPYSPAPFHPTRSVVRYVDALAEPYYETVYYGPSAWDRAAPWIEMGAWAAFLSAPFWMCGFD
jgi:hypothetical protein